MAFTWTSHGDPMVRGSTHYTSNEGHRLVGAPGKRGGKTEMFLHHPDGHVESLGKRATLDHAEAAIQRRSTPMPIPSKAPMPQGMHPRSQEAHAERMARGPVKGKMPQGVHPRSQEATNHRAPAHHPQHAHDGKAAAHPHAMMHGPKGGSFYVGPGGTKIYGNK